MRVRHVVSLAVLVWVCTGVSSAAERVSSKARQKADVTKKAKTCTVVCSPVEGRIPITGPTVITEPGSYVLVNNIGDLVTPAPITIQSDNVDLDLNGFTITGLEPAILAEDVQHISVHDGFLYTYEDAIAFTNVTGFVIRNLTIQGLEDCIVAVSGSLGVIEDNRIQGPGAGALCVSGSGIKIHSNQLNDNLYVDCTRCSVVENELLGDAEILGSGNVVKDNAGLP